MTPLELKAEKREIFGRKTAVLRIADRIPSTLYGRNVEPKSITVERMPFTKVYAASGESSLVDLMVNGGEMVKVLVQDVQYHPLTGDVIHADFRQVNMKEKIETTIALNFVGEAPAIKALGGIAVEALKELEVKALPGDLVNHIDVDLSTLVNFGDKLHVSDLVIPTGIEVLNDKEATVIVIEEPRSEAELAELDKALDLDVTKVEVAKAKKEGEEGEEGAEEGAKGAAGKDVKKDEKKGDKK